MTSRFWLAWIRESILQPPSFPQLFSHHIWSSITYPAAPKAASHSFLIYSHTLKVLFYAVDDVLMRGEILNVFSNAHLEL